MTDFHYFAAPTDETSGTLNPVYELLDFPIVMGGADDIVLTGPAPDKPLVDGREVSDPRLVKALSKPVEVDRAEVLDRSAKLAGVLRAMGVVGTEHERIVIAEDVPPIARALSILGAVRIGLSVDARSNDGAPSGETSSAGAAAASVEKTSEDGVTSVLVHTVDAAPIDSVRASVKVIRSRFEGVGITVAEQTASVDQAMRDSRVESAAVVPLSPGRPLIVTDDETLDAQASLEWLSREMLSGA